MVVWACLRSSCEESVNKYGPCTSVGVEGAISMESSLLVVLLMVEGCMSRMAS